jgi:hypothetical protein
VIRDDGLIARALAPLGRRAPVTALALLAVAPPLAAIAVSRSHALMAGAVAWMVVLGGASAGARRDRFDWLVIGLLRAGEYGLLVWIGLDGGFAVIAALTLVHYDLFYRPRHLAAQPPTWFTGGWDGRLVLAWVLLAAGALPVGMYAMAAALGALWLAASPLVRQGDTA